MQILDGKKIRDKILSEIKREISSLPFRPVFCDVLVGRDPSSVQYVCVKAKTAESVGMKFHKAEFAESVRTDDLIREIKVLNEIPNMCGIIVQLPLPEHIDRRRVLDAVESRLDADFLGTVSGEKFYGGYYYGGFTALGPPAALACLEILNSLPIDLRGKKITVLGQGELIGRPVTALLRFHGFDPDVLTSVTVNKEMFIKRADVIVSGIGKPGYIKGNMIKKGAILIDAGTSESLGVNLPKLSFNLPKLSFGNLAPRIVGDVDFESVMDVAGYISPVPGGVGPVTIAMLLRNVLTVAQARCG